jgi:hypothetical protein
MAELAAPETGGGVAAPFIAELGGELPPGAFPDAGVEGPAPLPARTTGEVAGGWPGAGLGSEDAVVLLAPADAVRAAAGR